MGRFVLVLSLLAAVAGLPIHAQAADLKADIPFAFQMGRTRLPAGTYVVSQTPSVVTLQEAHGAKSAMALFVRTERRGVARGGELEFQRYGNDYFLSNVWGAYTPEGLALLKSPREKELVRNVGIAARAGIALERK